MSKYPIITCDDCEAEDGYEIKMEAMKEILYESDDNNGYCYKDLTYLCPRCGRKGILTICYKEYDSEWKWVK